MEFIQENVDVGTHSFALETAREFPDTSGDWYWASLWPSSIALAEHVVQMDELNGLDVVELGCGCGLAGIAAGKKGGRVTVTDLLPDAVELASRNWELNGATPEQLQVMDWGKPGLDLLFDVILAADVLYDETQFDGLCHGIRTLLKPGGKVLLSEPGRPQARSFFSQLLYQGYRIETTHSTVDRYARCFEVSVSEIV